MRTSRKITRYACLEAPGPVYSKWRKEGERKRRSYEAFLDVR